MLFARNKINTLHLHSTLTSEMVCFFNQRDNAITMMLIASDVPIDFDDGTWFALLCSTQKNNRSSVLHLSYPFSRKTQSLRFCPSHRIDCLTINYILAIGPICCLLFIVIVVELAFDNAPNE